MGTFPGLISRVEQRTRGPRRIWRAGRLTLAGGLEGALPAVVGARHRVLPLAHARTRCVVGLWALPVFSVPLLLTKLSFRRYAAVRTTYRQTIASPARATEIAGYTPAGGLAQR